MDKAVKIKGKTVELTNLQKIYWPKEKYSKGELIEYYHLVSKYIMPYIKNRPHSLNRFPNGINGKSFYQKDVKDKVADWVTTEEVYSESNDENINYYVCTDEASLLYMVNLGCIEINPWFSTTKKINNPDYLAIDLDPLNISFKKVVETAFAVKEILDKAKAKGYCKTSGATGMHIYIPLNKKYDFEIAREFAHVIAELTNELVPDFTSIERSPAKRKRKVYIDYLQNRTGQTLAAPYSVRPRAKAPVSTPLEWKELSSIEAPEEFTMKNIFNRLKKKGDLFKGVLGKGINIENCLKNLGVQ
ncbi:MAG TPA: non-homologous end-joining DNA ligase [Ignavibacteria bacterium]|nr:DNA polymerase LigD [Bacteroidota bacterium]HRE09735.1 non-homologous end-joining DNA ligase [Ignavibacteria bacterium]HRF65538.1 non-homologous end-joining DNA ligase [Ignavibacteria bacterium]HRJ02966.1 non-homologous end-joining DNA ligase [Ignavibacteria bacterium]HRJ84203.1 non-homologous end-joining DNA ligase [Ignavibacteria bacterium]